MAEVPQRPSSARDVWIGIGLFVLCSMSGMIFTSVISLLRFIGIPGALVELLLIASATMVPIGLLIAALVIARRNGRPGIVKGLIIGISITVLLVAACFGLVVVGLSHTNR